MSGRFQGAIPRTPQDVADNLDLWEVSGPVKTRPYLQRALRRAAGTIRELVAERDRLKERVSQLEAQADPYR